MSKATTGGSAPPKAVVTRRLREAGIDASPFVDVEDGGKACYEHDDRSPTPPAGNYGIYAVGPLVILDVDPYEDDLDLPDALPGTFTTMTPHGGEHRFYVAPSLDTGTKTDGGSLRVTNQYGVGPGSVLTSCDKDWHDCSQPGEGHYTIKRDRPIARLSEPTAKALLEAVGGSTTSEGSTQPAAEDPQPARDGRSRDSTGPEGVSTGGVRRGVETVHSGTSVDPRAVLDDENDVGLTLREVKNFSPKLKRCLLDRKRADDPSPSETDFATVSLLSMYRFDTETIERVLLSCRRVYNRHVVDDYIPRTLNNADPYPPVPGSLLCSLVEQANRVDRPDASRDTVVTIVRAVESLPEPFTVADIVDSGTIDHSGVGRNGVMKRVRRALQLLEPTYIRMEKLGGPYQCIRTAEFDEVVGYARAVA